MELELIKSYGEYTVIGLLGFMGFLSLWFWIERLLFYKAVDIFKYQNKKQLEIDVTKHVDIISTCGSNAPYIGLLGTVFGIMLTFYTMGQSDGMDVNSIMSSLALALKATAMGLLVAIPAIVFTNHLGRKVDVLLAKWDIANEQ
ncbi:MAG: TonB-system energizer ExbB [Campylobacterota bacterium]